jgi:hypothetical protein
MGQARHGYVRCSPVIEQLRRRISELEAYLAQRQAHDLRPSTF